MSTPKHMSEFSPPPMRSGLFCRLDASYLEIAGASFFDALDGDLSAPSAIPMGGVASWGDFGPHTCHVPREWERHQEIKRRLARYLSIAD